MRTLTATFVLLASVLAACGDTTSPDSGQSDRGPAADAPTKLRVEYYEISKK